MSTNDSLKDYAPPIDFHAKPLLFGGMAMQWYGLREGRDIDFVILQADAVRLQTRYPGNIMTHAGDHGIALAPYEFWTSSGGLTYHDLCVGASETEQYLVIAPEMLLKLKALRIQEPKQQQDIRLLAGWLADPTRLAERSRPSPHWEGDGPAHGSCLV